MGEKLVITIVRIRSKVNTDKTVPIGFKVSEESIPSDIKPMKIHVNNLVNLEIIGKSIKAMIVAVGDDSQELIEAYKGFYEKEIESKGSNSAYEKRISHWFGTNQIKMTKSGGKALDATSQETFDQFLTTARNSCRREHAKPAKSSFFPSVDSNVIQLDSDGDDTSDDGSSSDYDPKSEVKSKKGSESLHIGKESIQKLTQQQVRDILANLWSSLENYPASYGRNLMEGIYQLLAHLIAITENMETLDFYPSVGNENDDIHIIPEDDKTAISDFDEKIILVEGIFPLPYKKYKSAIKAKFTVKDEIESGPAGVLNNIIKIAFPSHWLIGVTLRGSGGRKSLINIWNYKDPITAPLSGETDQSLGEKRFRALLDHCVRKSGKKSYDKSNERSLIATLAKAMHYMRTKLEAERKMPKFETEETSSPWYSDLRIFPKSVPSTSGFKPKKLFVEKNIFDDMDDRQSTNSQDATPTAGDKITVHKLSLEVKPNSQDSLDMNPLQNEDSSDPPEIIGTSGAVNLTKKPVSTTTIEPVESESVVSKSTLVIESESFTEKTDTIPAEPFESTPKRKIEIPSIADQPAGKTRKISSASPILQSRPKR
uniref:Uncharacterized protein n=1 Tax=Tetranychus urticae TaxID=32264 RepID=T1KYK4_TETUR